LRRSNPGATRCAALRLLRFANEKQTGKVSSFAQRAQACDYPAIWRVRSRGMTSSLTPSTLPKRRQPKPDGSERCHCDPSGAPTPFVDRYEQAVLEMLKKKQDGLPASTVKAFAPPRAVPDLMEAFRQSLAAVEAGAANDEGKPVKASRPKKKAKVEGQREMLLPTAGGKTEAEAKPAEVSTTRRKAG
jgi:hypothetical protein